MVLSAPSTSAGRLFLSHPHHAMAPRRRHPGGSRRSHAHASARDSLPGGQQRGAPSSNSNSNSSNSTVGAGACSASSSGPLRRLQQVLPSLGPLRRLQQVLPSLGPLRRLQQVLPSLGPLRRLQQVLPSLGPRVGCAVAAAMLAAALPLASPALPPAGAVTNEQLLFLEAWRAVDRAYVDKSFNGQSWFRVRERYLKDKPMSSREQTYAAIRTLLASLDDPFTRLLDPDQYAALRSTTTGSVTGVGVEISFDTAAGAGGPLVVVAPQPGGPADRAGIRPKDQILSINGQPTNALSLYAAANLLQGAEGTPVTLVVQPSGGGSTKELVLRRETLKINPVEYSLCSSAGSASPSAPGAKLGYIRVATFARPTAPGVREAIGSLQARGAEQFVLDIRSNGGGLFPAGVEVARMWINRGDIVLIADSDGIRDVYEADGSALEPKAALSVLVNRGTASAAEVLAGALKDNGRAVITGEKTFGKGLIQTLVPLSDGSALAVTVAKYQTPGGVDINKVGISPQLALDPSTLAAVPSGGEAFCKFILGEGAPALLGP